DTATGRDETADAEATQITRAARGTALNLVGAVVGAIVSFVTVGLITNVYGNAGAGLFFAATAAFTLAANAARLGAESSLTYFVSRFRADDRNRTIPSLVRLALTTTGATAAALGLIGFVTAPQLSAVLTTDEAAAATSITMIRILAVVVPTFTLSQAMFGATRGFATMRPSVVAGQIIRPVSQLLFVGAVIAVSDDVWPLAVAWAASSALTMASVGGWLRRRLRRIGGAEGGRRLPASGAEAGAGGNETGEALDAAEYWRFTAPRAVADLLSAALERLDVLLVAIIVGEVGAGMYGASSRLILAGQLMMIATAQSMAPLLSANFMQGRLGEAQKVLRTISGWNVILLWPVFICLAFGARTALSVFGSEFTDASSLVVVLAVGFLIIIGLGMGDTLLVMTGDSLASLLNHALALAVMVGTAIVLLPTVGLVGAAWAWAASRILIRLLAVWRVWRTKRIHAFGPPMLTAMAVAAVAYVPTGIMARITLGETFVALAVNVCFGTVVQLALLAVFRRRLELDRLLATLSREG
ncbi:MAG: oligosaccharide flippase family protein, partial [Acidimicrobiales bacterium]